MAPNAPPKPTPPRRSLTQKGTERKKPGPAPKPLSERLKNKPLKQVKRIERSYTRERKVEVLLYLLQHRVPDPRPRKVPRRRIGQPHEEELTQPMVANEYGELVWYRAPTYSEASEFWKIPTPTIQGWWDAREKILEGTGFELPKVGPGGVSTAISDHAGPDGVSRALAEASGEQVGEATGTAQTRGPGDVPMPVFRAGEGIAKEGQRGAAAVAAEEAPAANGAPPTPSSNPSSSPNTHSAPSTVTPGPGPSPSSAPSSVPRQSPGAQGLTSNPINGPPSTSVMIGTQPQPQQRQPPPPQPSANVAQRGPNGGVRATGIRAPRLAPAPGAVPVGHAGSQAPPHAVGPPPPSPAYAGPHPPPPDGIPPAFNPAHYVVLYTGPHPGPWAFPGQQCLPPGIVLPIVYANQPVGIGPAGFVSVYPAPQAPVPNGPPPPPPPNAMQYHRHHLSNNNVNNSNSNGHPGQHTIQDAYGAHPNSNIGQPPVLHGAHPPVHHPSPQSPHPSQGPPHPPSALNGQQPMTPGAQVPHSGPTGYVSPYAPPDIAGPPPIAAAQPSPTAHSMPGKLPKVAIPKLAPKSVRQQTQPPPPPPPPSSQHKQQQPPLPPTSTVLPVQNQQQEQQQQQQQQQPDVLVDGSIAANAPATQVQTAHVPLDGKNSTLDRPTPSSDGSEGDQASPQTLSPPEEGEEEGADEDVSVITQDASAVVPVSTGDATMEETETRDCSVVETSTEDNSSAETPKVEVVEAEEAEEAEEDAEEDAEQDEDIDNEIMTLETEEGSSSLAENRVSAAAAAEDSLMDIDAAEEDTCFTSKQEHGQELEREQQEDEQEEKEDEEQQEDDEEEVQQQQQRQQHRHHPSSNNETQFQTRAETPPLMETEMEDVLMQVSTES